MPGPRRESSFGYCDAGHIEDVALLLHLYRCPLLLQPWFAGIPTTQFNCRWHWPHTCRSNSSMKTGAAAPAAPQLIAGTGSRTLGAPNLAGSAPTARDAPSGCIGLYSVQPSHRIFPYEVSILHDFCPMVVPWAFTDGARDGHEAPDREHPPRTSCCRTRTRRRPTRHGSHDRDLFLFLNNDVELSTPQTLQVMAMQLLADRGIGFVGIKLYYPGGNEIQHGGLRFVEHVEGTGYPLLTHAKSASDFVDAERVSLFATFAWRHDGRRETFERLRDWEEVFFPNGFGDVDICLRELDAGYRNYYPGSLEGIHHEALSRGFPIEDIEFTRLHERHRQTIAVWRPRHLIASLATLGRSPCCRATNCPTPRQRSTSFVSPTAAPLPARRQGHRGSQVALGPAYMGVPTAAVKSAKLCLRLKSPGGFLPGMVQILGYSGNSTDRPHASTVGIRSVVGPIAGSGTLEAVPAQPVEPVRVRLASQELSGNFPIRSRRWLLSSGR